MGAAPFVHPEELATGLVRVTADGRIIAHNSAAARLLKSSDAALGDRPLNEIAPGLGRLLERARTDSRAVQALELTLEGDAGSVDAWCRPLDSDWLLELHPVTERLYQRRRVERADQQQALTILARGLAHELRNPLAGVRGAAQLVCRLSDDERIAGHGELIQREVDRITALIERFTEHGEPAAGPVNLHRILTEAVELIRAEWPDGIRIEPDFDPSIPEITADAGRLHQVFVNLLRNAAQAGADCIGVTTRIEHDSPLIEPPDRHAVRIDIDDNGRGVPQELRQRLFLPLVSGRIAVRASDWPSSSSSRAPTAAWSTTFRWPTAAASACTCR